MSGGKLLTTRNGHGQSGWSPIGCEGLSVCTSMLCAKIEYR